MVMDSGSPVGDSALGVERLAPDLGLPLEAGKRHAAASIVRRRGGVQLVAGSLCQTDGGTLHMSAGERHFPEIAGVAGPGGEHDASRRAPFERQDIGQPGGEYQPLRGQRGEGPGFPRGPFLHRDREPVGAAPAPAAARPNTST